MAPQIVEKKFSQSLAIDRRFRSTAMIELVQHAPDMAALAVRLLVRKTEMRIAHAVFRQVLAGARQHHDLVAAGVERAQGAFGQRQAALDGLCRWLLRFAGASGMRRCGCKKYRREDD